MHDPITDALLAEIVSISADAIICIDDEQRITFFNEGAEQIFGYTKEEIFGDRIEILIPERFRTGHRRHVEQFGRSEVRARRMGERAQISGLRKNGEEFPAEAAISHFSTGARTVYSVVLRDMTSRKRIEESQRYLAEAGETLALSLSADDTIESVARLAVPRLADACIVEVFHGSYFRGAAVGHIDRERQSGLREKLKTQPISPGGTHPVAQVARSGTKLVIENAADGNPVTGALLDQVADVFKAGRPAAAVFLPLVARDQLIGVMGLYNERRQFDSEDLILAEDLGRRAALAIDNARLHEQVRLGLRARDDMIGIVSHDLRNPVHAVKMLTGVILEGADSSHLSADVREYAGVIRQAAEQMDSLIRDLLDVTRIEAGRMSVELQPVAAEALFSDVLRTLAPIAAEKNISLRLDAPDDLPEIQADAERVSQAIGNVVGNAIKFTPVAGQIVVRIRNSSRDLTISIQDSGPGMTPEQLSHAFDRFWQSRRTDRHGAGLGLAITKGIVEAHGGRAWAESRIGEGSAIHLVLPLEQADSAGGAGGTGGTVAGTAEEGPEG